MERVPSLVGLERGLPRFLDLLHDGHELLII
jgi:hypothetical protein